MDLPETDFSPAIRNKIPGLKLGLLLCENINVTQKSSVADRAFEEVQSFITQKFAEAPPAEDEVVGAVRRMYRRIGWEPTRYRPSSEAMIRRIIKDKGLYRINNIVDLANVVSIRFHLLMGLYDSAKINGTITFDVGRENEVYEGISKPVIHAADKLILRDDDGIFGNPTADSNRTRITSETKRCLALFFTPPEVAENRLCETLDCLQLLYLTDQPNAAFEKIVRVCR